MSQQSMLRLAKRGDEKAIASVLNNRLNEQSQSLQVVESTLNHGCLRIVLESLEVPDQDSSVRLLHEAVTDLDIESAKSLMISAKQPGKYAPVWSQTLCLNSRLEGENINSTKSNNSQEKNSKKLPGWLANLTTSFLSTKESKDPEQHTGKINKNLLIIGLFTLTLSGIYLSLKLSGVNGNVNLKKENTTNSLVSIPQTDPFAYAVNKATSAATLTQSAKSRNEWEQVASLWQEAIELMQAVPETSSNYQVAQEKTIEYQQNLEYARSLSKNSN